MSLLAGQKPDMDYMYQSDAPAENSVDSSVPVSLIEPSDDNQEDASGGGWISVVTDGSGYGTTFVEGIDDEGRKYRKTLMKIEDGKRYYYNEFTPDKLMYYIGGRPIGDHQYEASGRSSYESDDYHDLITLLEKVDDENQKYRLHLMYIKDGKPYYYRENLYTTAATTTGL